MMENNLNLHAFQVLALDDLMAINGGAPSKKTILIGVALTLTSPVIGTGYWFGYFVNN